MDLYLSVDADCVVRVGVTVLTSFLLLWPVVIRMYVQSQTVLFIYSFFGNDDDLSDSNRTLYK